MGSGAEEDDGLDGEVGALGAKQDAGMQATTTHVHYANLVLVSRTARGPTET